jgi:glycosyltransferase involved in cell wall biosynthesis
MNSVKISIALPVYNGAVYLREALDSVLAQTFPDFELVISDNYSDDETPKILSDYASQDKRIRVSRTSQLLSQAENVNRSVGLCCSDWVKLFCHDDIMHPSCLTTLVSALDCQDIDFVGLVGNQEEWLFSNGHIHKPSDTSDKTTRYMSGKSFIRDIAIGKAAASLPSLTTAMVRKEAWERSGGFDARFLHFDVFLWTNLLMEWDYIQVPEVLTVNRIHPAQVAVSSRRSLRAVNDYQVFWKEFLVRFEKELALSNGAKLRVRSKALSAAGSAIAIELLTNRWLNSVRLLWHLPKTWWLVLPLFIYRSLRLEHARMQQLKDHVPASIIYPG